MSKIKNNEKTKEQLEEELRKTGEELAIQKWGNEKTLEGMKTLVKELIQKGKEMERVDRAKTDFISIASHQLRTPVSALNWVTEELQITSQNLNPKQQRYMKDLSVMSKRLIEVVEDLLDFSKLEPKTSVMVEKHDIKIHSFIEEFIKEMETYAVSNKHSIILNKKGISESLTIEINKKAFYSVLQNILSNAIDYSPENTAVMINLEKTDPRSAEGSGEASSFAKISISNKGPAIPKDEEPHIFERFYRGESARKIKQEGTGVGIVYRKENC